MKQVTRTAFDAYTSQIAKANGVKSVAVKFSATPSIAQTIENRIQESSEFLKRINFITVDEQQGEKVGINITSTIAGRTDTTASDRLTSDVHDTDFRQYDCKQTNFDTHLRYATLDAWAKFKDFQSRIRNAIIRQQALDRIMIGWNGTSAAVDTDRATYPLLQDVNIGWPKKLETEAAARYQTQGANAGEVRVGTNAGNDYKTLDSLVYDMRSNLLDPWHARDNTLICIVSSDLVDDKYFPMVDAHTGTPTESNALDLMLSAKRLGGLQVAEVPYFPSRTILITRIGNEGGSNLSIYNQEGTRRRNIEENSKRDRIENYESVNEAYVIEDLGLACAAVNIKYWDGAAWS